MPLFFVNASHWIFFVASSAKDGVSATGSSWGRAVPRRANVARIAWGEDRTVELEVAREDSEVVEVLHPAVGHPELDRRLELLCDDRLARVRAQARRGEVEQGGKLDLEGGGGDRVAEADVDLEAELRRREPRGEARADPAVLLVLSDPFDGERLEIEGEAVVVDLEGQDVGEDRAHVRLGRLAEPEQVEIAGRTVWLAGPDREERGPFSTNRDAYFDDATRKRSRSFA